MRKLRWIIAVIVIVIAVLTGVFLIKHNTNEKDNKVEAESYNEEETLDIYAWATVNYGRLESVYSGEATVSTDENEICDIYDVEYDLADSSVYIAPIGEELSEGDIIFSGSGQEIHAPAEGKIVRCEQEQDSLHITFLNYSKIYLTTYMPYDCYKMTKYDAKVKIYDDDNKYNGSIRQIGFVYEDGVVPVKISCDEYIMPGRTANVEVSLGETEDMLYVVADAVQQIGSYTYMNVAVGESYGEVEEVEVKTGRHIVTYEGGDAFEYVEILSGVKEGQSVRINFLEDE